MDKLSILVLHSLGDPASALTFLGHHVFALQRNYPEHAYLYHDAALPLPDYVAEINFDAIILDVTFLTCRWHSDAHFQSRKNSYSFVRESSAVKIAFPQDEYDCNELLDEWMCEWNVDLVFSVIASGWDVLYPRYHKVGQIRLGYTGYLDESIIDKENKPFLNRTIDIGYRAKKLAPYFGRIGDNKWTIGRDVKALCKPYGLAVDIELGDEGTLLGDAWLNFISNSKFTLGANSGSSLLDPKGDIRRKVSTYLAANPAATFDEVEAACFPSEEGMHSFTAISPRVLEAAMLFSGQILVDGEYSGLVKPWDHFIPIRQDASNFEEVLDAMSDTETVMRMIHRCREAILSVDALRYKNKARMILDLISDFASHKCGGSKLGLIENVINRYQVEMQPKYKAHWRKMNFHSRVARAVRPFPAVDRILRSAAKIIR